MKQGKKRPAEELIAPEAEELTKPTEITFDHLPNEIKQNILILNGIHFFQNRFFSPIKQVCRSWDMLLNDSALAGRHKLGLCLKILFGVKLTNLFLERNEERALLEEAKTIINLYFKPEDAIPTSFVDNKDKLLSHLPFQGILKVEKMREEITTRFVTNKKYHPAKTKLLYDLIEKLLSGDVALTREYPGWIALYWLTQCNNKDDQRINDLLAIFCLENKNNQYLTGIEFLLASGISPNRTNTANKPMNLIFEKETDIVKHFLYK